MKARAVLAFLFLALAGALAACPTCKDSFGNSPQTAGLAKGFYYSILFMLGILFSVVGFLVFKIVKEAKNEQASPPPA